MHYQNEAEKALYSNHFQYKLIEQDVNKYCKRLHKGA